MLSRICTQAADLQQIVSLLAAVKGEQLLVAGVKHTMLSYRQPLSIALFFWAACIACQASIPSTDLQRSRSTRILQKAASSPHFDPVAATHSCELRLLDVLGWQSAYNPAGYSISTQVPANLSAQSWESLGCLQSLTNLTLTGSMPHLPHAWGDSTSFPSLQSLTLAASGLAGSLPVSWHQPAAFPNLKTLNLSFTQLTGTLPASWAQPNAFPALLELDLSATALNGIVLACCLTCFPFQNSPAAVNWRPAISSQGSLQGNSARSLGDFNLGSVHAGTLPVQWGNSRAFASLSLLRLVDSLLSGVLPASWAGNNSLPALTVLEVGISNLTGTLPAEWGSPTALQRLEVLSVINCSISGIQLMGVTLTVGQDALDITHRHVTISRTCSE